MNKKSGSSVPLFLHVEGTAHRITPQTSVFCSLLLHVLDDLCWSVKLHAHRIRWSTGRNLGIGRLEAEAEPSETATAVPLIVVNQSAPQVEVSILKNQGHRLLNLC